MFILKKIKLLFVLALVALSSCDQSQVTLPNATGKLGSLVIVADAELHNATKDMVDSMFLKEVMHLPGGEPFFELLKPDPIDFARFFSNQKSVLVLVTEDNTMALEELLEPFSQGDIDNLINDPKPVLKSSNNLFAKYQHIVYLFGKDADDINRKLKLCEDQLVSALLDFEIKDQHDKLFSDTSSNDKYFDLIKKELGMGVNIPSSFVLKSHKDGFWWFQYDAVEGETPKTIALLAHAYPYKDTGDFSYASIRTMRDTVLKYHIKGELAGTYMGTSESADYPPRFREVKQLNGNYCTKIRGWWNMEGLAMGGPFIRYIIHNPKTNTLFAFEGFVYKPNLNTKEKDLRLIEAVALSIR